MGEETKLELLTRIRDELEVVLHDPQGVSATKLTEFRDKVNDEINELSQDESEQEEA